MNISKKKKIIVGFIITIFILVSIGFLFFTKPSYQRIRTSTFQEHTLKIRQKWNFGDFSVNVDETAVVMLPQEGAMFIIKIVNNEIKDESKRRQYAKKIAYLAYKNKIYEQANVLKISGKPIELMPKIGVAIIERDEMGVVSKINGYRYQFLFSELQ